MLSSAAAMRDRIASGSHASTRDGRAGTAEAAARLKQRWPCREQQVEQLVQVLCSSGSAQAPLFVFGPPATGKTAVVRDVLRELGVQHAYVNCQEASRPKPLLSSILHQLKGAKRRRDEGYDCSVKCDGTPDFLRALPGMAGRRRGGGPAWVVVDNAQRLAGSELLTALMRMRGSSGANVGVLLISAVGWSSGRYLRDTAGVAMPLGLHFPAYSADQLHKVLEHRRRQEVGEVESGKDAALYRQFLAAFLPAFCRASNNLLDAQAAVAVLYPRYKAPLERGERLQGPALYARIKQDVARVISQLHLHEESPAAGRQLEDAAAAVGAPRAALARAGLPFELPYISKFLLAAAYIASRNKPTSDRQVFDPTLKQRGRRDAQAMDRAAEAGLEARLRGPHAFPLERLLHIFYVLYPQHAADGEGEGGAGGEDEAAEARRGREVRQEMQEAEVLMQLATLVSLRLLSQPSVGDPLEGGLYRCNVSEEMAQALAANIRLNLGDYLKMG